MKIRTLAILVVVLVIAALCCAGCLQELPLGDKYINEAAGLLRVQNTSTEKSYVIIAVELRNSAGEVIKTWDGLALEKGDTWTGDLDLEGSFILYCTVQNTVEGTTGTFNHGPVEIKLHEVAESGITGEVYLSTADTDGDGFSDFWENDKGFDPADPSDGGTVYVSAVGSDEGNGTAEEPYHRLFDGVEKAKSGLTGDARTVVVIGELIQNSGNPGSDASMIYITDTGLHGVTVIGEDSALINAGSSNPDPKRALYLGPGTKLTLKNITITGGFAYRGGGIHADGAELTLGNGAVIQKCRSFSGWLSGAGVYGSNGAVIVMKDGSLVGDNNLADSDIKANEGSYGAGVALYDSSSLTMEAGSRIRGNKSNRCAALAVDVGSLATLEDGAEISGNNDTFGDSKSGFGHGGGVRLTAGGRLLMKGGLIADNTLIRGGSGGGVYVGPESVFEMQGGEIRGNSIGKVAEGNNPAVIVNGGGVYVDTSGIFNMSGGDIAGNTATGKGGGVYVDGGSFAKTGGAVYGSDNTGKTNTADGTGNGHALFATTTPVTIEDNTLPESVTL
jgi:hypothetical protein